MYLHYNILRISLFTLFFHSLPIHTFHKMFDSFVSPAALCSRRKMNCSVDTRRSFYPFVSPNRDPAANELTRLKRDLHVTTPLAPHCICKPRRFLISQQDPAISRRKSNAAITYLRVPGHGRNCFPFSATRASSLANYYARCVNLRVERD